MQKVQNSTWYVISHYFSAQHLFPQEEEEEEVFLFFSVFLDPNMKFVLGEAN